MKDIHLSGEISNGCSYLSFTQTYTNELDAPLECVYKFPTDPKFVIAGIHVKLDDREIDAQVMEKAEAEAKYDDAVASGSTAVKVNYDKKVPDVIELAVGALQPKCQVEITIRIIAECEVTKHGFYSMIFPLEFVPRYKAEADQTLLGQGGSIMPSDFSAELKLTATSVITNLSVSHEDFKFEQSEDGKSVTLVLSKSGIIPAKDIVISYSCESIREPQLTLTKCEKYPGEVLATITYIPRGSGEHDNDGK